MSDKNTAPAAQPNLTQPEKKDHTALIVVLVVLGVTVVLPMIIGGIIIAAVFGFAGTMIDHIDDWDLNIDDDTTVNISEGQQATLTKIWLVSSNKQMTNYSFAKKDCENLKLIAEQQDGAWFDTDICAAETISLGAEYDEDEQKHWAYLTDGKYCAVYNFKVGQNYLYSYKLNKHTCNNIEMRIYEMIDTGESADPLDNTIVPEKDTSDGEDVEIHIRHNGKSST